MIDAGSADSVCGPMAAKKKSAKRGSAPKAKSKPVKKAKKAAKPAPKRARPAPKAKAKAKKAAPKKVKTAPKAPPKKIYPKVTLPELPEIEGYVRNLPPPIVPIVNRLRQVVRDAAPEARELLDLHGPAYDSNGLFARIETSDREVLVMFLKGAQLEAPDGTLAGDGEVRSLAITSIESIRESVLQGLVRQAVLLNVRDPSASGAV